MVKNPPVSAADTEIQVPPRGGEAPLEDSMAAHSRILAWRIPWAEEPGGLQSSVAKSRTELKRLSTHALLESRKLVLMNLSTGQQWRCRHREGGEGGMI